MRGRGRNADKFGWQAPSLVCRYIEEQPLCFAGGRQHVDPKAGIARFGPKSYDPPRRHPGHVRTGFIGSAETIEKAKQWIEQNARGVKGDEKHPEFPGYDEDRGFLSQLEFDSKWTEQINHAEIDDLLRTRGSRPRFECALTLLEQKLRILAAHDQPPDYVVVALPEKVSKSAES